MTLRKLLLFIAAATVYCNTGLAEVFCGVAYNDSCMAYKGLPACFGPRLPEEGQTWRLTTEAFGCMAYDDSSKHVTYKGLPACFGPRLPEEGQTWRLTTEAFGCMAYDDSSRHVAYKGLPACFGPRLPEEGQTWRLTTEAFGCMAYDDSSKHVAYKGLPACFGPRLPEEGQTWRLTTEAFGCMAYNDSSKHVACKGLPVCFGPPFLAKGLPRCSMRVIPPADCHAENPAVPRNASRKCTALVQEYDCFFVEKADAQQAGYQMAVGHDVDSEELIAMMAADKEIQQLIKELSLFTDQLVSLASQETLQGKKGAYTRLLLLQQHLNSYQDKGESCLQDLSAEDFTEMFVITLAVILFMVKVIQCKKARKNAPKKARKNAPKKARKNALKLKPHAFKPEKYKTRAVCLTEDTDNDCLRILFCSYSYKGASVKMWFYTWSLDRTSLSCKEVEVNTNGGGDFLPEHAGEDEVEDEQNHEGNALGRGRGDGAYDDEAERAEAALRY